MTLNEQVKSLAKQLGFTMTGVVPAAKAGRDHAKVQAWVEQGFSAGMQYMQNFFKRADLLRDKLSPAGHIISLAVPYGGEVLGPRSNHKAGAGRIGRYALGQDYHQAVLAKMEELLGLIRQAYGQPFYAAAFVDTAALLERSLAEQAGIGFIGKNNCLIIPGQGSFCTLSEIATDLPLKDDQPLAQTENKKYVGCGSCDRCVKACPTGALAKPYQLDAGKCIAYLTIENKGAISEEWRPKMGNWVYGCDVCQEVCPYNQIGNPRPKGQAVFFPEGPWLDLKTVLGLENEESFSRYFKGSAILRPKRKGLLRNACVVAGNSQDLGLVPILEGLKEKDPEPLVREHAVWALGRLNAGKVPGKSLEN